MIFTLAWKEFREHQPIWLTMVIMTGVLGLGLAQLVSPQGGSTEIAALIVLGMAATYGAVCGAMMLAGEHENGTVVFLDVFFGRRGLLWMGKFMIGVVLAVAEALAVAMVLLLMKQAPPEWGPALIGQGESVAGLARGVSRVRPDLWFLLLPVVTLEAYAWGLLGSSLTRRVLSAAGIAASLAALVWLITIFAPPPVFLVLRLGAAVTVLFVSHAVFLTQTRETLSPRPSAEADPRRQFIDRWERFHRQEWDRDRDYGREDWPAPVVLVPVVAEAVPVVDGSPLPVAELVAEARPPRRRDYPEAESGAQVLWWVTTQQAWVLLAILGGVSVLVGFFVPTHGQVLWPVATLLLGVACGTAAFAPEQRDLSYQFLAAQHLPLPAIWRFKVLFWLGAGVLLALLIAGAGFLFFTGRVLLNRDAGLLPGNGYNFFGTLRELTGSVLFFGVWFVYGFCAGHVFVWLCRKSILALLISCMVAVCALGLWLPSLLCRGMNGWQLWVPPLIVLAGTRTLVRAWAGGRIKERRPLAALIGFGVLALAWFGLNVAYRAWEVADAGQPLDRVAFRAAIPQGKANVAGQKIQDALLEMEQAAGNDDAWLKRLTEAGRLPLGVIELPSTEGQAPQLRHLPGCQKMTDRLRTLALPPQAAGTAFERLAQILTLSRNLRSKAPLESYLAGLRAEDSALDGVDLWLAQAQPGRELLRRASDELNRHAAATPPPLDCLQTECFRAGGLLAYPTAWTFSAGAPPVPPGRAAKVADDKIRERWLAGAIALSLETPWEAERKARLWQLVWAGLFQAVQTPYWELPEAAVEPASGSKTTRRILHGWLPPAQGRAASLTAIHVAELLDASWLSDERLFAAVVPLRTAATRARWRMDASRLTVALRLYQLQENKTAPKLEDLVPNYLPELPVDPYSGKSFAYRIAAEDQVIPSQEGPALPRVQAGQAVLWSTGPDRVDHGGHKHGGRLADHNPDWKNLGLDLITVIAR